MKPPMKLTYKGCAYYLSEHRSELQDARYPWKRIPLKDWEILWIKDTGQCPAELSFG